MSHSRLIFFPENPNQVVDTKQLIKTLATIGFINVDTGKHNHHLPGEQFLSLLTFLGCSPNIKLAPAEGENYCYITVIEPSDKPRCLGYTRTANPKCPNCTKRIANWKTVDWQIPGQLCYCDKCHRSTPYAELNWKQECGFAQCGFEIAHIYPHEAIPNQQLLNALHDFSNINWLYCFANN